MTDLEQTICNFRAAADRSIDVCMVKSLSNVSEIIPISGSYGVAPFKHHLFSALRFGAFGRPGFVRRRALTEWSLVLVYLFAVTIQGRVR